MNNVWMKTFPASPSIQASMRKKLRGGRRGENISPYNPIHHFSSKLVDKINKPLNLREGRAALPLGQKALVEIDSGARKTKLLTATAPSFLSDSQMIS